MNELILKIHLNISCNVGKLSIDNCLNCLNWWYHLSVSNSLKFSLGRPLKQAHYIHDAQLWWIFSEYNETQECPHETTSNTLPHPELSRSSERISLATRWTHRFMIIPTLQMKKKTILSHICNYWNTLLCWHCFFLINQPTFNRCLGKKHVLFSVLNSS